jgi:hypothetical protein
MQSITFDRAPEDARGALEYLDNIANELRRAKWFEYAKNRFDLVQFIELIDWCAREPNGVDINEARRERVKATLLDSIRLGEFGTLPWPQIAYLRVDGTAMGRCPLRLSIGQIDGLRASGEGHDPTPHLWAPRALCRRWLDARGVAVPLWLALPAETPTAPPVEGKQKLGAAKLLPKFDAENAKALLAAQKLKGGWSDPPAEKTSRDFLLKHFKGVPNDLHRKIRNELWPGQIKRGPKPRAKTAE